MKATGRRKRIIYSWILGTSLFSMIGVGCGRPLQDPAGLTDAKVIPVKNPAWFQMKCQDDASVSDPYPRFLELWKCDLPVNEVELAQEFPTLLVEGDCEERVITLRPHGLKESTWKIKTGPADALEFDATIPYGKAILARDGKGNTNCSATLTLNVFGVMRCQAGNENRFKPVMEVNAAWWINQSETVTTTTTTSTSTTSSTTTTTVPGTPWWRRWTGDTLPAPNVPALGERHAVSVAPAVINMMAPAALLEGGACDISSKCYFYSNTEMHQCQ